MKTFSVRIEDELFEKVEAARADKARTDFLREVIEGYFVTKSEPELNQASPELIESLQSEISFLRQQVNELDRLLHQEQVISLQAQKQIMPGQEEIRKKNWWQFWKK